MLTFLDIGKKDIVNDNKYKSIRKSRNKMVEILAKLKNQNLLKFRFKNLFRSKKIQNTRSIEESNFLTYDASVVFTKLKNIFIEILIL